MQHGGNQKPAGGVQLYLSPHARPYRLDFLCIASHYLRHDGLQVGGKQETIRDHGSLNERGMFIDQLLPRSAPCAGLSLNPSFPDSLTVDNVLFGE
jgi:hypothetical protein